MVNHIVCWNFKEELSKEERIVAGNTIKEKLEAIKNCVSGAVSIKVKINQMESSTKDIALISCFESVEALNNAKNAVVRDYTILQQDKVNEMATNINNAIQALEKKPPVLQIALGTLRDM